MKVECIVVSRSDAPEACLVPGHGSIKFQPLDVIQCGFFFGILYCHTEQLADVQVGDRMTISFQAEAKPVQPPTT